MGYDNTVMAKHHHPIQGTVKDLASIVGCGRVHLSEVLNHKTLPSVELAKKIEFATGGHIKWTEFFEDHASLPEAS